MMLDRVIVLVTFVPQKMNFIWSLRTLRENLQPPSDNRKLLVAISWGKMGHDGVQMRRFQIISKEQSTSVASLEILKSSEFFLSLPKDRLMGYEWGINGTWHNT